MKTILFITDQQKKSLLIRTAEFFFPSENVECYSDQAEEIMINEKTDYVFLDFKTDEEEDLVKIIRANKNRLKLTIIHFGFTNKIN